MSAGYRKMSKMWLMFKGIPSVEEDESGSVSHSVMSDSL